MDVGSSTSNRIILSLVDRPILANSGILEPKGNLVRYEVESPACFAACAAEIHVTLFPYLQLELSVIGEPGSYYTVRIKGGFILLSCSFRLSFFLQAVSFTLFTEIVCSLITAASSLYRWSSYTKKLDLGFFFLFHLV